MILFTLIVPAIIYSLLLVLGIRYIKAQSLSLQIKNIKRWYVFLTLMPLFTLLVFHFTQVKK